MSSAEARQRLAAALIAMAVSDRAKAISDEQLGILLNARIEDADDAPAGQGSLENLTPEEVEGRVHQMLTANPALLDRTHGAARARPGRCRRAAAPAARCRTGGRPSRRPQAFPQQVEVQLKHVVREGLRGGEQNLTAMSPAALAGMTFTIASVSSVSMWSSLFLTTTTSTRLSHAPDSPRQAPRPASCGHAWPTRLRWCSR